MYVADGKERCFLM